MDTTALLLSLKLALITVAILKRFGFMLPDD